MDWGKYSFGSVQIDGREYDKDVIVDRGAIRNRNKKASKGLKEQFGHTPLSLREDIPWNCQWLLIGTGMQGRLPVMEEVRTEAGKRGVALTICTTPEAIEILKTEPAETNAILHLTC